MQSSGNVRSLSGHYVGITGAFSLDETFRGGRSQLSYYMLSSIEPNVGLHLTGNSDLTYGDGSAESPKCATLSCVCTWIHRTTRTWPLIRGRLPFALQRVHEIMPPFQRLFSEFIISPLQINPNNERRHVTTSQSNREIFRETLPREINFEPRWALGAITNQYAGHTSLASSLQL